MTDRRVLQSDALSLELRQWLRGRAAMYGANVIATTLIYEATALIALHVETISTANDLIDQWTQTMKDQVRAFGVGVEHP